MEAPYTCKHYVWQSWNHYGVKMWEGGCEITGGLFDCPYYDAGKCQNYEKKEDDHG